MRPETLAKIDALHAEIAILVAVEQQHYSDTHPDEPPIRHSIAHTSIAHAANPPWQRQLSYWAGATLPVLGGG